MKIFVVIILSLSTLGCSLFSNIEQTGTDHCSGWSNEVRTLADHSWKYAQLSQNVYENRYDFNLNNEFEIIEEFDRPDISYYSALFKSKKTDEFVFVFRGTDSLADFKTGNNPFKQTQNKFSLKDVTEAINKYSIKKSVVTGHSLGGGMATHVSLNIDNVILYTFNGSPVYKQINDKHHNKRYSIVERGEILNIVRFFAPEPDQLYTSIECTKGSLIKEHSMKELAICLTRISAVNDNSEALDSLRNMGIDKKWCKDKI